MQTYWGIDLGGTKIEGIVLNSLESIEPRARLRIDTQADRGYEHILSRVAKILALLKSEAGAAPRIAGVAHPGVVDPQTGLIKNSNTVCLNGKPLKQDLEKALGIETVFANDANCFALAEACCGAAKNAELVFGVIMGTGVGGGIVVNKRARYGLQGIAGEWGHNVLEPGGLDCYCGKQGCVETLISGPALEAYYQKCAGRKLSLNEIVSAARSKTDAAAEHTLNHLLEKFGAAIAVVVNILDPDCIVIGGGLSNIEELYTLGRQSAARRVFNDSFSTPIVRNELGDSAGVVGAAMLTR